jgi:hypothetical protein
MTGPQLLERVMRGHARDLADAGLQARISASHILERVK